MPAPPPISFSVSGYWLWYWNSLAQKTHVEILLHGMLMLSMKDRKKKNGLFFKGSHQQVEKADIINKAFVLPIFLSQLFAACLACHPGVGCSGSFWPKMKQNKIKLSCFDFSPRYQHPGGGTFGRVLKGRTCACAYAHVCVYKILETGMLDYFSPNLSTSDQFKASGA